MLGKFHAGSEWLVSDTDRFLCQGYQHFLHMNLCDPIKIVLGPKKDDFFGVSRLGSLVRDDAFGILTIFFGSIKMQPSDGMMRAKQGSKRERDDLRTAD